MSNLFSELKDAVWERGPRRKRVGATTESIALVAAGPDGHGCILAHDGEGVEADIEAIGYGDLDDHGLDKAPHGLSIWEGHMHTSFDRYNGDHEAFLEGKFRELTPEEWERYRTTGTPWEFEPLPAAEGATP